MSYVLQHIFGCLFVAALIGGIVGWLLRHFAANSRIGDLTADWTRKLELADGERERLSLKVKESEGAVSNWRVKFANMETEHGKLKSSLDATASKIPVLETAIAGWVAKGAAWDKSKTQLEADLKACADARSSLQVQIGDVNAKIGVAEKRVLAAEAGAKDWQGKYAALETAHGQLKATADATSAKIPALESTISGWAAKSAAWDKTKAQFETDLKAASDARAALQAEVSDLKGKVAATEQRVAVAEAGVKDWRGRFTALETTHTQLKASADTQSAKIPELETAVAGWVAKSATWDKSKAQLETQVADLTRQLSALDAERAKLKADIRKAADDDTIEDARYEKEIAALKTNLANMEKRAAGAEATSRDWQNRFATLETAHGQLRSTAEASAARVPGLEAAIAGWAAKSAQWDKSKAAYDTDVKVANDARASLETQVREWIEKAKTWDRDRAAYESRIAGMQRDLKQATEEDAREDAKYERTINGLRDEVSALQGKLNAAVQDRDRVTLELKRAVDSDEKDDAEFRKMIEKLRADLAASEARLRTAESGSKDWQTRFATLEGQWKTVAGERDTLTARLKSAADGEAEFRKTIEKLRMDLGTAEGRVRTSEAGAKDWQAKYAALEGQSKTMAGERDKLRADLGAIEGRLKTAEGRVTSLEGERTALTARATQIDTDWSARYKELEAKLAAAKPMAMAAAAGASTPAAAPADPGLRRRFDAFVVKTQKDGYGDIERIEGIGPVYGQKLRGIGIAWVKDLLAEGGAPQGRQEIADETGIDRRLILKWVNAADLLRLDGVTPDWAELLEASGVDTVKELRGRVAENLFAKMQETNATGNHAREVPSLEALKKWIEQAKKLDPKVTH